MQVNASTTVIGEKASIYNSISLTATEAVPSVIKKNLGTYKKNSFDDDEDDDDDDDEDDDEDDERVDCCDHSPTRFVTRLARGATNNQRPPLLQLQAREP